MNNAETTVQSGPSGLVLAIGVTLLIAFVIGWIVHLARAGRNVPANAQPRIAKASRFLNPITGPILVFVLALTIGGLWLVFNFTVKSVFWGTILTAIGGAMWHFGEVKHKPANEREHGTVHFWGSMVKIPGTPWRHGVVVKGDVILAPYFPFKLTTVKSVVESKDKDYTFQVTSKDGYTFKCKLSIRGTPNDADMDDFLQSGNSMDEVFKLSETAAEHSTRRRVSAHNIRDIIRGHNITTGAPVDISAEIGADIDNHFQGAAFGVTLDFARFVPEVDKDLKDLLAGKVTEELEREKEKKDRETMAEFARAYQRELAQAWHPVPFDTLTPAAITQIIADLVKAGKILTYDKCLDKMHDERNVREKRSNNTVFDFRGGVPHTVIIGGKTT